MPRRRRRQAVAVGPRGIDAREDSLQIAYHLSLGVGDQIIAPASIELTALPTAMALATLPAFPATVLGPSLDLGERPREEVRDAGRSGELDARVPLFE